MINYYKNRPKLQFFKALKLKDLRTYLKTVVSTYFNALFIHGQIDDKPQPVKRADVTKRNHYQIDDKPISHPKESFAKLPHTTKAAQLTFEQPNNCTCRCY